MSEIEHFPEAQARDIADTVPIEETDLSYLEPYLEHVTAGGSLLGEITVVLQGSGDVGINFQRHLGLSEPQRTQCEDRGRELVYRLLFTGDPSLDGWLRGTTLDDKTFWSKILTEGT